MRKPLCIFSTFVVLSLLLSSCLNDPKQSEIINTDQNNAVVTTFALKNNSDVANNLSSYKFTIDEFGMSDPELHAQFPDDGIIFNPDSLPYGAVPDSVRVSIGYTSPSAVHFYLYDKAGELGQYSDFANDSALFFASYPDSRLEITSRNGLTKRTYHIKINVHQTKGDSIVWCYFPGETPTEIWASEYTQITDQRVDTLGDQLLWFAELDGTKDAVRMGQLRGDITQWQSAADVTVEGGDLLDLQTLYAWGDALYAVGRNGAQLLRSTDGKNWTVACGTMTFVNLLGVLPACPRLGGGTVPATLRAIVRQGADLCFAASEDGAAWTVLATLPSDFPVRGYVRPIAVNYNLNMGNRTSRLYIVGGADAQGRVQASTWSCDGGETWVNISSAILPPAMTGASVVRYTLDSDHPRRFWLLYPGRRADGSVSRDIYFSEDSGISWHRLPRYYSRYADNSLIEAVACNSAFYNPRTYMMYYFGGQRPDGSWSTRIFGGVLPSLTYDKVR